MRTRTLALAGLLLLVAALWPRASGPVAQPAAAIPRPGPPPAATPEASPQEPAPARDPFRYADEGGAAPPRSEARSAPAAEPPSAAPAPLRLVGFVRRAGRVEAALSHDGDVSLAGPGDEVAGYAVLDVDEDRGVRLRGPDGTMLSLLPPE